MKPFHLLFLLSVAFSGCTYLGEPKGDYPNKTEETADYIRMEAPDGGADKGFLFYPGGLVDANAYVPWCDQLVSARPDVLVLIVKMPLNLAVFSPEKGLKFKEKHSGIERWIIGGHSLGGSMAARVVHKHPDAFRGLVFLGAYPAESDGLSTWNGNVLSLSAEHDGLCTPDKIESHKSLLPQPYPMGSPTDIPPANQAYTAYYQIPGGNHAQFGSYGPQKEDGEPTITRDEQHAVLISSISQFIQALWL